MRCCGRTKSLSRCKIVSKKPYKLFCRNHVWQPVILLLVTIPTFIGVYGGLYRDVVEPLFTPSRYEQDLTFLEKPITIVRSDIFIKDTSNCKFDFTLDFFVKNFSNLPMINYNFKSYSVLFDDDWEVVKVLESNPTSYSNYTLQPKKSIRIKQSEINLITDYSDISEVKLIFILEHTYKDERQIREFINYDFRNITKDITHDKFNISISPDSLVSKGREVIDSIRISSL